MQISFRTATKNDILKLHAIRTAVTENVLSDPNRITQEDYLQMLEVDGKGWLCEANDEIAGFAIVDMKNKNIWALFVHPDFEGRGMGKKLFNIMVDWSFTQGIDKLWLTTAPGTRAEHFYSIAGWQKSGLEKNGEIRFECTRGTWQRFSLNPYQY